MKGDAESASSADVAKPPEVPPVRNVKEKQRWARHTLQFQQITYVQCVEAGLKLIGSVCTAICLCHRYPCFADTSIVSARLAPIQKRDDPNLARASLFRPKRDD